MIVGRSKAIERARQLIERYAPTRLAILVIGPTGVGKELVAREIHRRSGRPGALVDVNWRRPSAADGEILLNPAGSLTRRLRARPGRRADRT